MHNSAIDVKNVLLFLDSCIKNKQLFRLRFTKDYLFPKDFLSIGNECRNNRNWPIVVSDAVCIIQKGSSRVLQVCAPPLCAKNRKSRPT